MGFGFDSIVSFGESAMKKVAHVAADAATEAAFALPHAAAKAADEGVKHAAHFVRKEAELVGKVIETEAKAVRKAAETGFDVATKIAQTEFDIAKKIVTTEYEVAKDIASAEFGFVKEVASAELGFLKSVGALELSLANKVFDVESDVLDTAQGAVVRAASSVVDYAKEHPVRFASTAMGIAGGALLFTGVGAPIGGALIAGSAGIAASQDIPNLIDHPDSLGAWLAVGADAMAIVGGANAALRPIAMGAQLVGEANAGRAIASTAFKATQSIITNPAVQAASIGMIGIGLQHQAENTYHKIKDGTLDTGDILGLINTGIFVATGVKEAMASRTEAVNTNPSSKPRRADMKTYAKDPVPVSATPQATPFEVKVSWQDAPLQAQAGDYLVSDGASSWPVAKDVFEMTYTPTGNGSYVKTATVQAVQMDHDFVVETLEGTAAGKTGDFLVQGPKGEAWPIPRDTFFGTYKQVS